MRLETELAAMEHRWERQRRACAHAHAAAVTVMCLVAAMALIVFAAISGQTRTCETASAEAGAPEMGTVTGELARPLTSRVAGPGGDQTSVGQASHTAGPSLVADQLHSKMERNCR